MKPVGAIAGKTSGCSRLEKQWLTQSESAPGLHAAYHSCRAKCARHVIRSAPRPLHLFGKTGLTEIVASKASAASWCSVTSEGASMQTETAATAVNVEAAPAADTADQSIQRYQWTPRKFCQSISLFILSAASEVGGGWLVWQSIRSGKPWWWGLLGSVTLVVYGFIPTLQPVDQFGRTFAAYGGFFIVYSYGWGWLLDHERPDTGDFAGAGIALAGVCICWFWPRKVRTD